MVVALAFHTVHILDKHNFNVARDWINNDIFLARNGDVTLDGINQMLLGSTTFYNLNKTDAVNDSIEPVVTFDINGSIGIDGAWTFTGIDSDDQIILQPTIGGNHWFVNPQGTRSLSFLDVTYSNNVSGTTVNCTNGCTDSTNNIDWNFTAGIITVAGTVYTDEGTTNIGAGTTVRLVINGVNDNTDVTDVNGAFSITSGVAVGAGAVLTLYLDTGGGNVGVTVTLSSGNTTTDQYIYRDYLVVRSDSGAAISNINLDTANNNADADIGAVYTMAGNVLTLVNGKELLIHQTSEYVPGDDLNIGSSGETTTLDINGTLTMAASEMLTVRGTMDSAGILTDQVVL